MKLLYYGKQVSRIEWAVIIFRGNLPSVYVQLNGLLNCCVAGA